jgi:alkane 1-monooxygenase
MHFFIEHNRGHHKNIGTKKDPATARKGESLYEFWIRAIWQSYWHAWKIENDSLRKKGIVVWSLKNQMLRFQLTQITLLLVIFFVFGWFTLFCFVAAAVFGFVLLETIDYVEHYGLTRKELSPGVYERTQPHHSWDSNFPMGRLVLFELSRHADHHYLANRKYQILRSHESAPQMPTGYPGMMILSLVPPLWFAIMNKRLALQTTNS